VAAGADIFRYAMPAQSVSVMVPAQASSAANVSPGDSSAANVATASLVCSAGSAHPAGHRPLIGGPAPTNSPACRRNRPVS
jgi:hypothetical protein